MLWQFFSASLYKNIPNEVAVSNKGQLMVWDIWNAYYIQGSIASYWFDHPDPLSLIWWLWTAIHLMPNIFNMILRNLKKQELTIGHLNIYAFICCCFFVENYPTLYNEDGQLIISHLKHCKCYPFLPGKANISYIFQTLFWDF